MSFQIDLSKGDKIPSGWTGVFVKDNVAQELKTNSPEKVTQEPVPVTDDTLLKIEEVLNAEYLDDAEDILEAYFDEMPILIAEIRRLRRLLDGNGIER